MRRNVGGCDRVVRLIAGLVLLPLGLLLLGGLKGEIGGLIVAVAGALALATGVSGFCPLYVPLGISTARGDHWMHRMLTRCGWDSPGGRPECCGRRSGEPESGRGGAAARS